MSTSGKNVKKVLCLKVVPFKNPQGISILTGSTGWIHHYSVYYPVSQIVRNIWEVVYPYYELAYSYVHCV